MNGTKIELVNYRRSKNLTIGDKLKGDVYNAHDTYDMVLKSVRNSFEADVGIYYLNALKDEIPNFVYYYDVARGVAPFIQTDQEYIPYAGKSCHIFMERVVGVLLRDVMLIVSIDDINAIILQILLALRLANKRFGFQHGNLHAENIIVTTLNEPINIIYDDITLTTKYIVTIIDYGCSKIMIDGAIYQGDENNFFNDIYRLFSNVILALERRKIDFRQTLYYRYILQVIGEIDENDNINEWKAVSFLLAFYDYFNTTEDLDQLMLDEVINELMQITTTLNSNGSAITQYRPSFPTVDPYYTRAPNKFERDVNILVSLYPMSYKFFKKGTNYYQYQEYLNEMFINMCHIIILQDQLPSSDYTFHIHQLILHYKSLNSYVYKDIGSPRLFLEDVFNVE